VADDRDDFHNPSDTARSKLFDLRYLIGALFVLYGAVLTVAGFFTTDQAEQKANGININLWLGLGMLATGVFFLAWARTRPLRLGRGATAREPGEPRRGH
jgi:drug/metabolite transporter (DMT)-like permease